ncbi:molybdopterin-dependent oxidoreductase [Halomonas campisalis]|uniref:Molybdopterin-dependent oxidoreductase n=1 Tax=Billgrantia campisalis TaxID=74661 RepID=A0ABS9PBC9_9GAMM|nr:molybdopterin-dependent oxidoreductase [Halomonas campisalis]MCG6659078.1 molybdopterin-dependent oxidoreductase [Halomonas campisalis]MDR5863888.1 molybdopterin-dependent oxidoreductase [Halomonas campisalis]
MTPSVAFVPTRRRSMVLPLLVLVLLLMCPVMGLASNWPQPVSLPPLEGDRVVLRVTGEHGERGYTLAQIEALGLHRVTTTTFWPEDGGTYEGVLLADLLAEAGLAEAAAVRVLALDGFSQILPREDWQRWSVLLATRQDGQPMATRDKGPLRVIYPRDADPRLEDLAYRLRWVWLVQAIEQVAP